MNNKRTNLQKIHKCSICGKAQYKSIVPGAVSFFDRCTLTQRCNGRLTIDQYATVTTISELSWSQTPVLGKVTFDSQRVVQVWHNFGHVGSIVVEVFIHVLSPTGIISQKTTEFNIIEQTAASVTIDLGSQFSGSVVITDNQYHVPSSQNSSVGEWIAPNLLSSPNILTIAADRNLDTLPIKIEYQTLLSQQVCSVVVLFKNHMLNQIGGTIWDEYNILAVEKPYYMYSVALPIEVLSKGTTLQLLATSDTELPTIIIPMAVADKLVANDITYNKIIRGDRIELGDLMVDNNQLVVVNYSIVDTLRKPFTIY